MERRGSISLAANSTLITARDRMKTTAKPACQRAVVDSPRACATGEQPGGDGTLPHSGDPFGRPDRAVGKKTTHRTAKPPTRLTQKSTVRHSPARYVASRNPMT